MFTVTLIDCVPSALNTMVWFTPSIVYVTVAFGVPVKFTVPSAPKQTSVLAVTLATGNSNTVTLALPVAVLLHAGVVDDDTDTKVYS